MVERVRAGLEQPPVAPVCGMSDDDRALLEAAWDAWTDSLPRPVHPLEFEELRGLDRGVMVRQLAAEAGGCAELVSAVVRAFAVAALSGAAARTHRGWDRVFSRVQSVLAAAIEDGIRDARLGGVGALPDPPDTAWALAYAVLRGHMAARFRDPLAATAEGRSQVKNEVLRRIWDALLDAVSTVPRPRPRRPGSSSPPRRAAPRPGQ